MEKYYSNMGISKIKTYSQLSSVDSHNTRAYNVVNADNDLSILNKQLVHTNQSLCQDLKGKIDNMEYYKTHKVRKNAVLAIEIKLSFTHGADEALNMNMDKWEQDSLQWLQNTFNDPINGVDNILSCTVHYDESTPHIHAVCCLEYNGRINTIPFIGGPAKMRQLQTSYGKLMQQEYGLEPSSQNSVANHIDIKRFYKEYNNTLYEHPAPMPGKNETIESYSARVSEEIKNIKARCFKELKEKDKEIIEVKNTSLNYTERIKLAKYEKENKHLYKEKEELIREYGPIKEIKKQLEIKKEMDEIIKEMPIQRQTEYYELEKIARKNREKEHQKEKRLE